ncbi:MAG: hypothetical protein HQ534_07670 [Armatimonadetes bacterium]|nr:hypothetical protein [Armatimonadota bacterium]
MKLMDSKNLWEHKFFHNNLHCLDIPMSITLAILNGLLFAGHVKDKYYEEYDQLGSSEKELVQNYIANTLNESPETIKEEIKNRKFRKIRFRFIKAQRFPFLKIMFGVFSWLHTFFTRFISPPGDFIALVGPDGSGKSTLAEMIKKNCKRIYPGITYFHLFPKLKIFRYFDKKSFKRWENRHQSGSSESALRKKEFGFMASFIRLIYLWLRYTSGYFFEVILKTRKGHLVLSDRWCFDIIFDPGSKGIQLQQWIRKMVFYLIPKPSANLVLIGKPEVFAARKDDLTVEDIQEQITTMKIFFSGSKQSKLIRTDQNPEESFKETLNFLVNRE